MDNSETAAQTEVIEIIQEADTKSEDSWTPIEGETVHALKKQIMHSDSDIDKSEWETVKHEAISVLSKCVSPKAKPKQETGLVIGYVQSGKTLSFTTVAALARDNGYRMVIVITGTSLILTNQSTERLKEALNLPAQPSRWYPVKSSEFIKGRGRGAHTEIPTRIKNVLYDWEDPMLDSSECRTVLITVMKNHHHLKNLTHILSKLDLSDVPTLVIDDEGDQASLNTMVKKNKVSPTYQHILCLKECLQHHTFLQYTATPQALLLINLIDTLSPNFAKVLCPGSKYTGGKAFFHDAPDQIRPIPFNEIQTKDMELKSPPKSLHEAMMIFFLGVSAGRILEKGNRWSMMVHPSRKTDEHKTYLDWINKAMNNWSNILPPDGDKRDRQDLLEIFRDSYQDLQKTVSNLPSFDELYAKLPSTIRRAEAHEVNASHGRTPDVSEFNANVNILVGGQAMDRGFTVKGLTVTYMPRGKGVGNADTIQQRARFFGYKKDVFEYCRVFLENHVREAFEHYIIHEDDVRQSLIEHDKTGKPLDEWIRMFKLNVNLKPTRDNVLDIPYSRIRSGGQWYAPTAPHDSFEEIKSNRSIVKKFLDKHSFHEDEGHPKRTKLQTHDEADILLKDVYEELLLPYQVKRLNDTQMFKLMCSEISIYLESHPRASCKVYHMSKGELRERSLEAEKEKTEAELLGFFQGSSSKGEEVIYPGDRDKKASGCLTVQIHNFKILQGKKELYSNVPVLSVWIPNEMSQDWLVQNQGGVEIGS